MDRPLQIIIGAITIIIMAFVQIYISRHTLKRKESEEKRINATSAIEALNLVKGKSDECIANTSTIAWANPCLIDSENMSEIFEKITPKIDYKSRAKAQSIIYIHFQELIDPLGAYFDSEDKIYNNQIEFIFEHVTENGLTDQQVEDLDTLKKSANENLMILTQKLRTYIN
ncbi:hypothetical protein [Pseudoalteromonas sp. SR44-2]|uniref:hypothetical protein n=1 Tax=Pseudoalteromonas sp. SR44-2 TaxID=2760937 RepID=UPI0016006006|nr:hypothetical protein [Pseudoalteromonas sp. SR44-2]MBB1338204.1 hypothetical protein [Pseudoalteromonas sp. SR44-2]